MQTISLAIDGMSCQHCVRAVRMALESVDNIQVDEVAIGSARIQVPDDATTTAAIEAIDDAGYSAQVGAPPAQGAPTLHSLGRHQQP